MTARPIRIALTGPPAAGKSEVASILASHGLGIVDVGAVLADRLSDDGALPRSRAHIGPMFVERYGIGEVFDTLIRTTPRDANTVFDAIRAASTVQALRTWDSALFVLHVDASLELRQQRLERRIATWDDPADAERAYAALSMDTDWCRRHADAVILNEGSAAALGRTVHSVWRRVRGRHAFEYPRPLIAHTVKSSGTPAPPTGR